MSRVRYRVTAMVVILGMLTYLDRACVGTLTPQITHAFGLSKVQMASVFSAFAFAYAIGGIPGGWLADRLGTRVVLTAVVVCWSLFTVGTGLATSFGVLIAVRVLFGAGEAAAWPCAARTFSRWMPRSERGIAQGTFFAGSHFTSGVTPSIVLALLPWLSWREIFVAFGALGLLWAAVWAVWFRDDPAQHRAVSAGEREFIQAGTNAAPPGAPDRRLFGRLARSGSVWATCVMYLPNAVLFYFCITWLPTYLRERHHLSPHAVAIFSGLPLVLAAVADFTGGVATDWAVARFGLRRGQRGLGAISYGVAAAALVVTPWIQVPILAGCLIALATAASMFTLAAAWGTCIEIGGKQAAVVGAVMNTSGQVGSFFGPYLVAYTLKWSGSWSPSLWTMGLLFAIGAACWCAIDPEQVIG